jgi:DNA-3-methyladenine glycosylase
MPPDFFNADTVSIARSLLGQLLIHQSADGLAAGRIVETEAYLSVSDLASHSASGQTKRNAVMFGPPGHAYIYFTYGMHWLLNVVTGPVGAGEAVLIRALEPLSGVGLMQQRRRTANPKLLCSGPAKLTQALGITSDQNGASLTSENLRLEPATSIPGNQVIATTRIGIARSADLPLRFYIKNNLFVSKP